MNIYRRFILLIGCLLAIIWFSARGAGSNGHQTRLWRHSPHTPSSPESLQNQAEIHPPLARLPEDALRFQSTSNSITISKEPSRFSAGKPKPHGSTYTKGIVIGRMLNESTSWLDNANFPPTISKHIYISDRLASNQGLTTDASLNILPTPKGHEAMVYLTYIIENYSSLPDISIFLHAHQHAWHNNELLNHDAVEMIKRLSAERVSREGYMNLRCHWTPGCPEYIHPHARVVDDDKKEEGAMAEAWEVLFPDEPVPDVIASACCAQFAVSRDRIREIPLRKFELYREWLLRTRLSDDVSGRVFEYLWHKVFTGHSTVCPDMRVCYCDGYGVCFEDDREFDYWFELRYKERQATKRLEEWKAMAADSGKERGKWKGRQKSGSKVPATDEDLVLQREIEGYQTMLEERRSKALQAGIDPMIRARVAGRPWKEGDGY